MWRVIVFWPFFCQILADGKKHTKQVFQHIFIGKKANNTILRCYYLGQVGVIIWAKFAAT